MYVSGQLLSQHTAHVGVPPTPREVFELDPLDVRPQPAFSSAVYGHVGLHLVGGTSAVLRPKRSATARSKAARDTCPSQKRSSSWRMSVQSVGFPLRTTRRRCSKRVPGRSRDNWKVFLWPRLLLRARVLCVSCVCLVCKIFRLDEIIREIIRHLHTFRERRGLCLRVNLSPGRDYQTPVRCIPLLSLS